MVDVDVTKTVFFVTPIGSQMSEARRRSDDVLDFLLRPAVQQLNRDLEVVRADQLAAHGRITDKIVDHLLKSAVVVVDATGLNANVFYELGIAHGRHRPVVLLVDDPETIPFDTRSEAHLVLPGDADLGARTVKDCLPKLVEALRAALSTATPTGPVASAEAAFVEPDISPAEATDILRETISELAERIDLLERTQSLWDPEEDLRASRRLSEIEREAAAARARRAARDERVRTILQFVVSIIRRHGQRDAFSVEQTSRGVVVVRRAEGEGSATFSFLVENGAMTAKNFAQWVGVNDVQELEAIELEFLRMSSMA